MGEDIANALENLEEVDFDTMEPVMKQSTDSDTAKKAMENKQFEIQYGVQCKEYERRRNQYRENKVAAEALLWNQCTNTMKSKIQSRKDYLTNVKGKPVELLQAIKQHALSYESTQYRMKTVCDAMKSFVNLRQKEDESSIDYLKRFKAARDVFYSHTGKGFCFPVLLENDANYVTQLRTSVETLRTPEEREVAKKAMQDIAKKHMDEFHAYVYLENADRTRYGSIVTGLESQFNLNNDQYPKTLIDAQNVMENHPYDAEYKRKKKQREDQRRQSNQDRNKNKDKEETPTLSFAQLRNTCYCCGKNHKLPDCPVRHSTPKDQWHINKAKEAQQYQQMVADIESTMNNDIRSASGGDTVVSAPPTSTSSLTTATTANDTSWHFFNLLSAQDKDLVEQIIIDSGSSTDLFCNGKWLEEIQSDPASVNFTTNAGQFRVDKMGTLPDYGKVSYHKDAVTNIMSLAKLCDKYRVTFDSLKDDAFYVHTDKRVIRFGRNDSNLYAHTPSRMMTQHSHLQQARQTHVQTVQENMKFHTPREIKRAKQARDLLATLGSPSIQDLKTALATNAIANVPVTTQDVDLAERVFGPDLGTVKGKTTRRRPMPIVNDQIAIPPELYERRSELELCIDIMFVNEMPFLTTITRALYYRTALFLPTRKHQDLYTSLDEVLRMYNHNGFTISKIFCDGEFRPIMDPVKDEMNIDMRYSAAQAHVPEAERNNRTIKERIRATYHRLAALQEFAQGDHEDHSAGECSQAQLFPQQEWNLPAL